MHVPSGKQPVAHAVFVDKANHILMAWVFFDGFKEVVNDVVIALKNLKKGFTETKQHACYATGIISHICFFAQHSNFLFRNGSCKTAHVYQAFHNASRPS